MVSYDDFQILIDEPANYPSLGFDKYAEQFAQLIRSSRPQFSISILASWGSGKTTLMNEISRQLTSDATRRDIICVDFNAWRYEREPDLIIPLLDSIRADLQEWMTQSPADHAGARSVITTIGRVARAFAQGLKIKSPILDYDVGAAIQQLETDTDVGPSSLYFAAFRELKAAVPAFINEHAENGDPRTQRRIVVFIDDLDRCLPDRALQLLEHMKLFFDIEGFVFVAGIDSNVIGSAVAHHYHEVIDANRGPSLNQDASAAAALTFGQDYLKKIFQVPFPLPPIDGSSLPEYINALATKLSLADAQRDDLRGRVCDHLQFFVDGAINPREIKLLVNAYTISLKLLSTRLIDPKPDVALAIQVLASRHDWKYVYEELIGDAKSFPDELRAIELRADWPWSFVGYIEGPGRCLVDAQDLDTYVAVVEATRSTDPAMAEALRTVKSLRRGAAVFTFLAADRGFVGLENEVEQFMQICRAGLDDVVKKLMGPSRSVTPGGLRQRVLSRAAQLNQERWLTNNSPSLDTLARELSAFSKGLSEVEEGLSDLRQITDVGAAS